MNISVEKATGTYADALQAIGTAALLEELTNVKARIEDRGDAFLISVNGGKNPADWKPPQPGFQFIWRESKDGSKPPGAFVLEYEQEREIAQAHKKWRASKKVKQAIAAAAQDTGDTGPPQPTAEYWLTTIIESMRKGWAGDKQLYRWIVEHPEDTLEWVRAKLADPAAANPLSLSNSQILNPSTGKGVNASKAVACSAGSIPKFLVDPFAEWMKLRGLYCGLLAYRSDDDFKFMVIEPADIAVTDLAELRNALRHRNLWGGIRLDIESTLCLLQELVRRSDAAQGKIKLRKRKPNRVVRGLRQAFFKNLGTAAALMNDALFPLPAWFEVATREDVNDYIVIANEPYGPDGKRGTLNTLQDDRSGDVPILQQYRMWLLTGKLTDLLEFHSLFAVYAMERLSTKQFVRLFQADILELLIKKGFPEMKEIVTNSGFRSVARAIRNTTIYAAGMSNSKREIRFGLAQKWKQRIKAGDAAFLATLSEFVQEQNWEVTHKLEGKGHVVTETDLNEVVQLVEKHKAELVGMLLLAYGYARAERTAPQEGSPSQVEPQPSEQQSVAQE